VTKRGTNYTDHQVTNKQRALISQYQQQQNQKNSEAVQAQITTKQQPNQQNVKGTTQDKGSAGTNNQLHLVPALEQSQKSLETVRVSITKTATST
jgi:hypothetical protein